MPRTIHPASWPDKLIFAAMLLIVGGTLGVLFALVRMSGLTLGSGVSDWLYITPAWLSFLLSAVALVMGTLAARRQSSTWAWSGVACGIASVGTLGITPLLSLVAVGLLLRSRAEGEEEGRSGPLHVSLWPDKAFAASFLIAAGGIVALSQAYVLWVSAIDLALLRDYPFALGAISLVAALWCFFASFEIYRLRRAWAGYVGAALCVLTFGFVLVGPALGIATLVMLRRADAENEFEGASASA